MRKIRQNLYDKNDLEFTSRVYGEPIGALPVGAFATHFLHRNYFSAVFHCKPINYQTTQGTWRPLSDVALHHGNRYISLTPNWYEKMSPSYFLWLQKRCDRLKGKLTVGGATYFGVQPKHYVFATNTDFFPGSAGDPVDGVTVNDTACDTFANQRAKAGNAVSFGTDTGDQNMKLQSNACSSGSYIRIYRSIYGFDTSSIGAGQTVSAGTFSVFGVGVVNNLSQSLVIDRRVPASTNALVNADFNIAGWSGVEQSTNRISLAAYSTTGYNDFILNATGYGNVNILGDSWYGIRGSSDFDNSAPVWADVNAEAVAHWSEAAGTTNDPKLNVTYAASISASSVPISGLSFMHIG